MGGRRKWPVTRTTELGCSGRWMANAIRSSTDWKSRMRRLRKCSAREPGIARPFRRTTGIGRPRTLQRESGIAWTEPIAQEFRQMVRLGMAPMDAIQSATSRAAEMLDMKGEIGVIAPGAYAEVIAVSADPLKDVGELEHVRFVMHNGSIFKNEIAK